MTSDDHDDHNDADQPQDRGDSDRPTRDAKGRWLPGHCPNPKGRPKKKLKKFLDESDLRWFGNTLIDVVTNGQMETMDRRTALNNKIFESAMKGKVSMQRFLYREFARSDERLAAACARYEQLVTHWFARNPDSGKRDFEVPLEIELEIRGLRSVINHYFPGAYPPFGMSADDDSDDDDDDDSGVRETKRGRTSA
jgi:hypothetical protein